MYRCVSYGRRAWNVCLAHVARWVLHSNVLDIQDMKDIIDHFDIRLSNHFRFYQRRSL
jgi:hypothetical protein